MSPRNPNWDLIPEYMRGGMARYIEHGILPGSFLTAVLCNDLREACSCADDVNRHRLFEYMQFLYCDAPGDCWGSPENVKAWVSRHAKAREAAETEAAS